MSELPTTGPASNADRPGERQTILVMTLGTVVSVAIFAAAFVVRLVDLASLADALGTLAVVALLVTPAIALVTTALELRLARGSAAALALLVLLILVAATALALLTTR